MAADYTGGNRRTGGWAGIVLVLGLFCGPLIGLEAGPAAPGYGTDATQAFGVDAAAREQLAGLGVERVIFATRLAYDDPHWYANIGYYCDDENQKAYAGNGKPDESRLYEFNTRTGHVRTLMDAEGGGIRDPHVHYDGRTILFSYRPAGQDCYNLYELDADSGGLKRLTDGPYDDYEAAYLPDDEIVFVSTRSRRWVGCWMTQVGTLFRCDRGGGNIRPLSFNLEHDNTPAVLADGRIIYTRWEYVDRSQVGYHQLWAMNPDGTNVTTYFGNQSHYPLYIEAKPIPGTDDLLLIDSPGHGQSDHRGHVCTISAKHGPDNMGGYRRITPRGNFNDPWPINRRQFLVASYKQLQLGSMDGTLATLLTYRGQANIHEPAGLVGRPRERVRVEMPTGRETTGRMVLADVYHGRNMQGVRPGDIKKLLILEVLPKPVNFSGGMDLTSWMGTFSLERVIGTVPVEEDGSAYFEVPAGRAIFFVALDANDMSVKRMQSFTNVHPGETLSCVGCHEPRTVTPSPIKSSSLAALQRGPSRIESFEGIPDVLDFRRDIQPILTEHCTACHSYKQGKGQVVLEDGLGPAWSISYYTLVATGQVADGRNGLGNQPPRTIGSSASALLKKIDGSHHDVRLSPTQWRTIWAWLECGAPYAGTYAALRNAKDQGRQGIYHAVFGTPAFNQTCRGCHSDGKTAPILPTRVTEQEHQAIRQKKGLATHERIIDGGSHRFSVHVLVNASHPENSPLLLAPLAESDGGWQTCTHRYNSAEDPVRRGLLAAMQAGAKQFEAEPRYGMANFRPNAQYIREMKRFGVLPADFDSQRDPIDYFETDQRYWRSFWVQPAGPRTWAYLDD